MRLSKNKKVENIGEPAILSPSDSDELYRMVQKVKIGNDFYFKFYSVTGGENGAVVITDKPSKTLKISDSEVLQELDRILSQEGLYEV